jgi:hypothetical protein
VKHNWLILVVLLLLVGLGAAGCSGELSPIAPQAAPTPTQPGSTETRGVEPGLPTPTIRPPQTGPAETIPESVTGATEVTPPPEAQDVVRLAKEDLAQRLGLAPDDIRLVSVEAVDWSDTSLGCPQPGMMYAQVITAGYRVVLEAEEQRYEYHTDTVRSVVLCEKGKPSGAVPSKGPDASVQDGWPNQTRDNDVIIVPPAERK